MGQAGREKAYHIEDVIDEYILHLAKKSSRAKPTLPFTVEGFLLYHETDTETCDCL